ncbi:glycosyltransferase, partial [Rhizobium ruizarguesonis]
VPTFISLTAFQRLWLRKFAIEDAVFGSSAPKASAAKV